jgi:hypothetical protein
MTAIDPLAHLQPKQRDAEKKARLIELADSILKARLRGVSLTGIAKGIERLKKRPIKVSVDYVNEVMAEYHGDAWPKPKPRTRYARTPDGDLGKAPGSKSGDGAVLITGEANGEAKGRARVSTSSEERNLDAFAKRELPEEL